MSEVKKLDLSLNRCDSQEISSNLAQKFANLKNPPKTLFYKGDLSLLDSLKVAIVGTRTPNPYTKSLTAKLAHAIAKHAVVVSGGAFGVDIIAHTGAMPRTIMISPSSLDIIYPRENAKIIAQIAESALILSEYERDYMPHRFSFLERNRLVVALSDIVILPQGDLKSGTHSSANYALRLNKPIFTIPHRYNESTLTNALLAQGKARAIYNIDDFIKEIFGVESSADSANSAESSDEILAFCAKNPAFEDALAKFGNKILEYEFDGKLVREGNNIGVAQ
ncbi:DNA-processing protein DprA [Helicobacter sp. 23-1045]